MFNIINKKKEEANNSMNDCAEQSAKERIRHESFDVPNLNESLEPETMPEFVQVI